MVNKAMDEMYTHALNLVQNPELDPSIVNAVNIMMDEATKPKLSRFFARSAFKMTYLRPLSNDQIKSSRLLSAVQKMTVPQQHDLFSIINRAVFISATGDILLGWLTRPVIMAGVIEYQGSRPEIREKSTPYLSQLQTDRIFAMAT
jgi:hypothetical protein